jgi:hypothetical protein
VAGCVERGADLLAGSRSSRAGVRRRRPRRPPAPFRRAIRGDPSVPV